ncbi:hypothetical protein ABPG74_014879 [Tetrahymena malaccensis]
MLNKSKDEQKFTEFQKFCNNIGQSFLLGSAIGIPCFFYHGYRYAPVTSKFQAGWQLAKTRGVLLGTNFLVWRLIFESSNHFLKKYRGKDDVFNWAAGGAFVGWILTIRAGPKLGLIWGVIYSGFYQGQYFFNKELESFKQKCQLPESPQMEMIQNINDQAEQIWLSIKLHHQNIFIWRNNTLNFLENFKYNILEGFSNVL